MQISIAFEKVKKKRHTIKNKKQKSSNNLLDGPYGTEQKNVC